MHIKMESIDSTDILNKGLSEGQRWYLILQIIKYFSNKTSHLFN